MTTVQCFGSFELLPEKRRLLRAGQPVRLGTWAFDVPPSVVEGRGRLVGWHELQDRVSVVCRAWGPNVLATSRAPAVGS